MHCSSCVVKFGRENSRWPLSSEAIPWLNRHMSDRALQGLMIEVHYRQCRGPLFRFVDWALSKGLLKQQEKESGNER